MGSANDLVGLKPRILLVDDLLDNRQMWQLIATVRPDFRQWRIDFADCGAAALKRYQEAKNEGYPYELLILDIAMPDVTGIAVARSVREEYGDSQTKIMFLTAYDNSLNQYGAEDVNAAAYLTKPLTPDELAAQIASALE